MGEVGRVRDYLMDLQQRVCSTLEAIEKMREHAKELDDALIDTLEAQGWQNLSWRLIND